ncbi:MAG: GTP pyrophosphokinase [Clostridium sp.]
MALEMFKFIDETLMELDDVKNELTEISEEIEEYFNKILQQNCEGYINISSRVKGKESLKEKIIRNNYYKKGYTPEELINRLSDLIGIRLECRFIKDEEEVYKILREHFNILLHNGYSINSNNENISIEISTPQPQYQKNGFSIYRIDGKYLLKEREISFEVQIKSLVNIFWGEIEHKIIYKNNSYHLIDSYIKDIMSSIKKNLMMIDHQLLVTYNQFNAKENNGERHDEFEKLLSKIIYDAYAVKMKKNLGFVVDFKKPCDTILRYFLRDKEKDYTDNMIKILSRLNEINSLDTRFDSEISFERDAVFNDIFEEKIGNKLLGAINTEFQWNLFFRIIFEIEPLNNIEDFEAFIIFFKECFTSNPSLSLLKDKYSESLSSEMEEELILVIAEVFLKVDSIEFIVDNSINEINLILSRTIQEIIDNISSRDEWINEKELVIGAFYIRMLSIFDLSISTERMTDFIERVYSNSNIFKTSNFNLKYLKNLSSYKTIKAKEALKLLK